MLRFLLIVIQLFINIKTEYIHLYQRPDATECFYKDILSDHPILHFKLTVLQSTQVYYRVKITNKAGYKVYDNVLKISEASFGYAQKVKLENVESGLYTVCFTNNSNQFSYLTINDHHHVPIIFKNMIDDKEVKKVNRSLINLNNKIERFKELLTENKIKQQHHNYLGDSTTKNIRFYFWLEIGVLMGILLYQVNEWKKALKIKRTVKLSV